jgi:hypothetical protein
MATIDVTEVLFDPDFVDEFVVTRRVEVVSGQGRVNVTTTVVTPNPVGVVTATTPADLQRRDDLQSLGRSVNVVTTFRLRGPGPGHQPDLLGIDGVTYTVVEVLPYTRFGPGFVEARAVSGNAVDLAAA